ncbi:MAG: hypothetical protein AABW64_03440 [Nanoarchaeota archaeon]
MNKKIKIVMIVSVFFLLAYSLFGQAQDRGYEAPKPMTASITKQTPVQQDRTPVPPQDPTPPECKDSDKGNCQAVCNTATLQNGQPNPLGCISAFQSIPQKVLCQSPGENPYLVGCDMPSAQACTLNGNVGVWCNCYHICYNPNAT